MVQGHTASPKVMSQSTRDLSQAACSKSPLPVSHWLELQGHTFAKTSEMYWILRWKICGKTTCVLNEFKITDRGRALNWEGPENSDKLQNWSQGKRK